MPDKNQNFFDEVFLQYHPMLLRFGKKLIVDEYLVEECIQELFIYLYEKNVNLAAIGSLKAYLFTAFRRRLLLKKKSALQFADITSVPTDFEFFTEDFVYENEVQEQKYNQLSSILNDLPWRQREAVFLKYFNKLSAKEIAEVMCIQPQVVANTIYKALKKMRDIMSS